MRSKILSPGEFLPALLGTTYQRWTRLLLPVLAMTCGSVHAGNNDLSRLLDSAGDFSPPFSSAGLVYSQSHHYPELLLWPHAADPSATLEVRANSGSFQRLATGRTLAVGRFHVAMVRADGKVVAWGRNYGGESQVPAGLNNVVSVAVGDGFTLALRADGTVATWGDDAPVTTGPRTATGVVAIAADPHSSYVVLSDGSVQSWGGASPVPAGLPAIVGLESYGGAVWGYKSDGAVVAWNYQGISNTLIPPGFETAVSIAVEGGRYIALKRDGTVAVWSNSQFNVTPYPVPDGLRGVVAVAAEENLLMALKADGTIVRWNQTGVVANPAGLTNVVTIDAGANYSAALKSDGTVTVWGDMPEFVFPPPPNPGGSTFRHAAAVPLNPGSNTVEARVTPAGNGVAKTYTLNVNRLPNADLRMLEPDREILSPVFSPDTTAYTLSLPFGNDVIRWRAATDVTGAAVELNGEAISSGPFSNPLPLLPGINLFTFSVTAEDGLTVKSYSVTVTRGPPQTTAALRHLAHMAGPLVPAFSPDQLAYTHAAPVRQPRLVVWPRVADIAAKVEVRSNARPFIRVSPGPQAGSPGHPAVIQPDGMPLAWNADSPGAFLPLPTGIAAMAAMSSCQGPDAAFLRTDGKVVPVSFNLYNANHPAPVVPAGGPGHVVEMAAGGWDLCVALRTDGTALTWYRSSGEIFPAFTGLNDIISVAAGRGFALALRRDGSVAGWGNNDRGQISIPAGLGEATAVAAGEEFAMALRRDGTVLSWGAGAQTVIPAGLKDVAAIYAKSGQALALRADGTVARLGFSGPAEFSDGLTGVQSIAGGANANIAVKQDGVPVVWNYPATVPQGVAMRPWPTAPAVPLDLGANNVEVRVTAESGAVRTYTLAVTREANVDLEKLHLDFGTLSPGFSPETLNYSLTVPAARETLLLTPLAADDTSVVRINGAVLQHGGSGSVALTTGMNTITVQLLAEDGSTMRTYLISITRLSPNPNLSQLAVTDHNLTPPFAPGVLNYTQSVRLSSVTAWPRQSAAGASLEARANGGAWIPLSTGNLIARGGSLSGSKFPVVVRPDGTVSMPSGADFSPPAGLAGVVSVAAGDGHCLALKSDGTVVAWGNGNAPSVVQIPADVVNVAAIAAAENFSLALLTNGTVRGWGVNTGRSLDIPPGLADAVAVAAYGGSQPWGMALRRTGAVVTWGAGLPGPLPVPAEVQGAVAIAAGTLNTDAVALLPTGRIIQWTVRDGLVAREFPSLTGVVAVAANHVLRRDGTIVRLDGSPVPAAETGTIAALEGWYAVKPDGSVLYLDAFSSTPTGWTVAVRPSFVSQALAPGQNVIDFRVTEGGTFATHTVTLAREPNSSLRQLFTSAGPLQPAFSRTVQSYAQTHNEARFTVWPAPVAAGAIVEVRSNGGPWVRTGTEELLGMEGSFFSGLAADGTLQGLQGWTGTKVFGTPVSAAQGAYHNIALLNDGLPIGTSGHYGSIPSLMPSRLPGRYSLLSAGYQHAVGILQNGTLRTWGNSANGRLVPPAGVADAVQAEAGDAHTVVLREDGTVMAWGLNTGGQTSVPAGLRGVVAVAAGGRHSLALRSDGTVAAWGENSAAQTNVPSGLQNVTAIAAGDNHSMALKADGTVSVWGSSGLGAGANYPGLSGVIGIAAGYNISAGIRNDGSVVRWGTGSSSLMPPEGFQTYARPRAALFNLHPGPNVVQIRVTEPDAGPSSITTVNVTRLSNANLTALSLNTGELSPAFSPDTGNYTASVAYGVESVKVFAAAGESGVVVRVNGVVINGGEAVVGLAPGLNNITVAALGADGITQRTWQIAVTRHPPATNTSLRFLADNAGDLSPLFDPATRNYSQDHRFAQLTLHAWPQDLRAAVTVTLNTGASRVITPGEPVAMGVSHALAIRSDGKVIAWGDNSNGKATVPADLNGVVSVAAGREHSAALRRDGSVVAWGSNGAGQIAVPAGLGSVVAIAAGGDKTMALKEDGSVVVWGSPAFQQTTPPSGMNDAVAIAAGQNHCLALRRDGTVVTWGENASGTLKVPVDLTNVADIGAGFNYSVALKADGSVVRWGASSVPLGITGFASLAASGTAGIRADGTVAAWPVGQNSALPADLSGITSIHGGSAGGLAVGPDGAVMAWGTAPQPPPNLVARTGSPFAALHLAQGANTLRVRVTAEDGSTNGSYTVNLNRIPNTDLTALSLAGVPLSPAFDTAANSYTATVTYLVPSVTLTASTADPTSVIRVNGSTYLSGQPLQLPLTTGANVIQVAVTAEGGLLSASRTITVTRAAPPLGTSLRFLGTAEETVMTDFRPERTGYNIPVAPAAVTFWPRAVFAGAALRYRIDAGQWQPLNAGGIASVTGNSTYAMALRADGGVSLWGSNISRMLDAPAGMTNIVQLSAGSSTAMALRADGAVYVWGNTNSNYGQFNVPSLPFPAVAVAAGDYHCLALLSNGAVIAWGRNSDGQSNVPSGLPPAVAVVAGASHSLALSRDGRVFSWGSMAQSSVPASLAPVVGMSAGSGFTAVLQNNGTIAAWGNNTYGQTSVPAGLSGITSVACGWNYVLALREDGTLTKWGGSVFSLPSGLNNLTGIAAGGGLGMAVRRDGTISVFGDTSMGLANVPAGLLVPALPGSITIPVHPGVNAVVFEVTAPGGSESLVYSVTTRASFLPAYTLWAGAAFPVGTPATALAAGADPDGDGIPNGVEFLTGSSPTVPGPGPLTVRSDAGELVVSFSRASTIPDGLETVEVSVTPGLSWSPVPAASILRTDNGAGLPQTVIVRLPRTSERMFVRLKVVF